MRRITNCQQVMSLKSAFNWTLKDAGLFTTLWTDSKSLKILLSTSKMSKTMAPNMWVFKTVLGNLTSQKIFLRATLGTATNAFLTNKHWRKFKYTMFHLFSLSTSNDLEEIIQSQTQWCSFLFVVLTCRHF